MFGQSCARTRKSAETRHHVFLSTLKFRQKKTGSPSSLIFNQLTVHPLSSSWPMPPPHLSHPMARPRSRKSKKQRRALRYKTSIIHDCALFPTSNIHFFQLFAGNLAYSVNEEGLRSFFAPVASDMYAFFSLLSLCYASLIRMTRIISRNR